MTSSSDFATEEYYLDLFKYVYNQVHFNEEVETDLKNSVWQYICCELNHEDPKVSEFLDLYCPIDYHPDRMESEIFKLLLYSESRYQETYWCMIFYSLLCYSEVFDTPGMLEFLYDQSQDQLLEDYVFLSEYQNLLFHEFLFHRQAPSQKTILQFLASCVKKGEAGETSSSQIPEVSAN